MTSDGQSELEVITTNNTVLKQILSGDMRKNYYMVGSTWTNGGAVPNGAYSPQTPNNTEIKDEPAPGYDDGDLPAGLDQHLEPDDQLLRLPQQ